MLDFLAILYFIIGGIVAYTYWNLFYEEYYEKTKNPESGMISIILIFSIFCWPYCLYKILTRI